MSNDLWPDFDLTSTKSSSPKIIIEQAGGGLGKKTEGIIVFYLMSKEIKGDIISLTFSFYSRTLAYHYPFLNVRFPLTDGYPVQLVGDKLPEMHAANEGELLDMLGRIFQAPNTIGTIQKLISLSVS